MRLIIINEKAKEVGSGSLLLEEGSLNELGLAGHIARLVSSRRGQGMKFAPTCIAVTAALAVSAPAVGPGVRTRSIGASHRILKGYAADRRAQRPARQIREQYRWRTRWTCAPTRPNIPKPHQTDITRLRAGRVGGAVLVGLFDAEIKGDEAPGDARADRLVKDIPRYRVFGWPRPPPTSPHPQGRARSPR